MNGFGAAWVCQSRNPEECCNTQNRDWPSPFMIGDLTEPSAVAPDAGGYLGIKRFGLADAKVASSIRRYRSSVLYGIVPTALVTRGETDRNICPTSHIPACQSRVLPDYLNDSNCRPDRARARGGDVFHRYQ